MRILSRLFLPCALLLCALTQSGALAESTYPVRPIKIVVPFAAGGSTDLIARSVGAKVSEKLGKPVVVENRPGAGGESGITAVLGAPADGYSLLITPNGPISISSHLRKVSYKSDSDLVPLAMMVRIPTAIAVNAKLPVTTIPELVEHSRKSPDGLTYGISGVGTHMHLAGEIVRSRTGAKLVAVPYKGASGAALAVASGEVSAAVSDVTALLPHAKAGALRILAVIDTDRAPIAPELPPISESLAGFGINAWIGLFAKAGTPPEIVALLNKEFTRAVMLPEISESFTKAGLVAWTMTSGEMSKFISGDIANMGSLIVESKIKLE